MPFSEEVPANFKQSCPCKRRGCPLQKFAFEVHLNQPTKRLFTYQCSKPEVWASCNKTIAPNEADPTKPQPASKPAADKPFKCHHEGCTYSTDNVFLLNKHLDSIHHTQPPAAAEPTTQ